MLLQIRRPARPEPRPLRERADWIPARKPPASGSACGPSGAALARAAKTAVTSTRTAIAPNK